MLEFFYFRIKRAQNPIQFQASSGTHKIRPHQNTIKSRATTHPKKGNTATRNLMKTILCVADFRGNMFVQMQANEVEKAIFLMNVENGIEKKYTHTGAHTFEH